MISKFPNAGQSWKLLLGLILLTFSFLAPYLTYRIVDSLPAWPTPTDSFVFYTSKILAQIFLLLFALRKLKKLEDFKLTNELRLNLRKSWIYAIVCGVGLIFLLEPIEQLIPSGNVLQIHFGNLSSLKSVSFVYVVLLSPILNELIFRGIILRGLLQNYKPFSALLLSSALFAVYHVTLLQVFMAFLLGIFFGFVYWQTRSVGLVILLHMLNNGLVFVTLTFTGQLGTFEQMIANTPLYLLLYFISAILVSISLLQLYKLHEAGN